MSSKNSTIPQEYIWEDGSVHICKNDRCEKLVPRSRKYAGRPREYHDIRCKNKQNQRIYNAREVGSSKPLLYRNSKNQRYQLHRRREEVHSRASEKYQNHIHSTTCPERIPVTNNACPGLLNPNFLTHHQWTTRRQASTTGEYPSICIIAAVYRDDWIQAMKESHSESYKRQWTTEDGRWLEPEKYGVVEEENAGLVS